MFYGSDIPMVSVIKLKYNSENSITSAGNLFDGKFKTLIFAGLSFHCFELF
jgi:hypothetical protein